MLAGRTTGATTHRADFDDLVAVATNLRWTWKLDARRLFARLDPSASRGAREWPHQVLEGLGRDLVEERLMVDDDLAALADRVVADYRAYGRNTSRAWFPAHHRDARDLLVAFFAAEFALTDSLPIFAGGLGTVAAEQMKAASSLGLPLVGVGLLYRGTSHQWLDVAGRQHEAWDMTAPEKMPLERVRDASGREVLVSVSLPGRDVAVAVHQARVGRNRLLLLDADVAPNSGPDRLLTTRLYDSDPETRLAQEVILGVGGRRALAALDLEPTTLHLNEGHTAFAALEQVRRTMAAEGLTFDAARVAAAPGILFTTHTPVAAGHDYFAPDLARAFLAPYANQLGVDLELLLALGRVDPGDLGAAFSPTVFAMRLARYRNGVSRLHGRVTRAQWAMLWPRTPLSEVPIAHVTNGVHLESWIAGEFSDLLTKSIGPRWVTTPGDPAMWRRAERTDDAELWAVRNAARADLVDFARRRAQKDLRRRNAPSERISSVSVLDPDALTIGFVGRFVAYKRPTLLLRDPERLARILTDAERPVQVVFAGKAHASDEAGKALLQDMIEFAAARGLSHRVVFMVDFDAPMDQAMAQGVDLWLNTPRRPLEACGVGSMKAGVNGVLNLSTIDGWWDEALTDNPPTATPIGFTIGTREEFADEAAQDDADAASLYDVLEREIVPCFYDRDEAGVPRRWLAIVKHAMATLAPTWDSLRMAREYADAYYLPGRAEGQRLLAGGAVGARERARRVARLAEGWGAVSLEVEEVESLGADTVVTVGVDAGDLGPADLAVQVWVTREGQELCLDALARGRRGNRLRYVATVPGALDPERRDWAARVVPSEQVAAGDVIPGLVTWSW